MVLKVITADLTYSTLEIFYQKWKTKINDYRLCFYTGQQLYFGIKGMMFYG